MEGKRPLHHDLGNLIMLFGFELGVLSKLGAILFPGPKWVRAKDAKDAKVRKAIIGLSLVIQFFLKGKRGLHHDQGNLIMLFAFELGVLGELGASRFPGPKGGSRKGRQGRQV